MLNKKSKKSSFKQFIQGNGFYILTGVTLIAVVVTAMLLPKKGEGNVAEQPEKYATNRPAAAEDISDLRVPTIDPRMDIEDELPMSEDFNEEDELSQVSKTEDTVTEMADAKIDEIIEEEITSETFSSTTPSEAELFHADNDLFAWPVDDQVIYGYSDNEQGRSFMNPTLERTMRSFGLFLKADEQTEVKVAAQGKVISITEYPTADIPAKMDYPQVGTAVIIDHGNDWKTVYGLHEGKASVKVGDTVEVGDVVGAIGQPSKDFSLTGANLYFQVLKNDLPVNPEDMLN